MAILIAKEPMIKTRESFDLSTQFVSEFNEINDQIPIIDPEYLNLLKLHNNDDTYYVAGILISLVSIYYFIYEIIKTLSYNVI